MPDFVKGGALKTPFGKNVYLRSTAGCQFESYTVACATVPAQTIDGVSGQKMLQSGTAMAKITSGPDTGKIGPYQATGTSEVQTITITGAPTGGSYTLTITNPVTLAVRTTAAIPFNATAAQVQAALIATGIVTSADIVVAGGPHPATAITVTFFGNYSGDVTQMGSTGSLTGGTTPAVAVTTTTPGVAGAADGRQTLANLVGLLDTFLPWQTMEGDREVSVLYIGTAVQAWCLELLGSGATQALQNATADAMRSVKGMDVTFK